VGVLDALDDLIENNRRRIELLEQMAQAIYREWFVRFRYPGHEDATFVDSPLGPIPEGWGVRELYGVTKFLSRGIAPKYADDGTWTVINQRCIRHGRTNLDVSRRQERQVPPAKQVRFGDVLVNSTGVGTLGRVATFLEQHSTLTADSHVTIVRPNSDQLQPWLGLGMLEWQTRLEQLGTGSTGQTELSRDTIGKLKLVVPTGPALQEFAAIAWPLIEPVSRLLHQNRKLVGIRDLLLPKLVTGEIDVSQLDLDALVGSVA
jgi:type I restriction enzyme S subunit